MRAHALLLLLLVGAAVAQPEGGAWRGDGGKSAQMRRRAGADGVSRGAATPRPPSRGVCVRVSTLNGSSGHRARDRGPPTARATGRHPEGPAPDARRLLPPLPAAPEVPAANVPAATAKPATPAAPARPAAAPVAAPVALDDAPPEVTSPRAVAPSREAAPEADAPAPAVKEPDAKGSSALYGDEPATTPEARKLSKGAIGGIIAASAVGAAALAGVTVWATTRGKGGAAGDFSTS